LITLQANGKAESGSRTGSYVLSLLSAPLNVSILEALAEEPKPLAELRRRVGSPPQTTLRKQLRALTQVGILSRQRQDALPGRPCYELTAPGTELLKVANVLQAWLAASPDGSLPLGSVAAKSATKALVDGWSTSLLRALSARPFSLTELDDLISNLSYPSLERRLTAMRYAGQIQGRPRRGRGREYAVTDWLRRAAGPLVAAARWERLNVPEATAPVTRIDTEALFLLAVPLLRLPERLSGACRLVMEVAGTKGSRLAGVVVGVGDGQVESCTARLDTSAAGWASGSAPAWLGAIAEQDTGQLEIGGDSQLARALLDGLHDALFGAGEEVSVRATVNS
jgi:DNA-binding HxlR family transcriptional regulator